MCNLQSRSIAIILAAGIASGASNPPLLSTPQKPAVAWSAGVVRINGADHSGSGNVLPGSSIDTMRSAGQLYLADGSRLRLAADTRLKVDADQVQLQGGAARIDSSSNLSINAGALQISTSSGTVQRPSPNQLIVTAANSPAEVRKTDGLLIAMVRPGQTLSFEVPANLSNSRFTQMTGRVSTQNGRYYLTDELTSVKAELDGVPSNLLRAPRVSARGELVPSQNSNPSKLLVREIAEARPPQGQSGSQQTPPSSQGGSAQPAATGSGAGTGTAGTTAAGTAGAAGGLSTTAIVGITIGVAGGLGATLGVVQSQSRNSSSSISVP